MQRFTSLIAVIAHIQQMGIAQRVANLLHRTHGDRTVSLDDDRRLSVLVMRRHPCKHLRQTVEGYQLVVDLHLLVTVRPSYIHIYIARA